MRAIPYRQRAADPETTAAMEDDVAPANSADAVELTILMPCLDEAKTVGLCINKAREYLVRSGIRGEILVADNGSVDGSVEIAEQMGARVVHASAKGYGAALIAGIEAARGRYIIMGDADDSYDFESLDGFVDKLRAGADLVVGNQFEGGIDRGAMPWLHYYLGNPLLSFIGRIFFQIPVRDFHCGLRGFRTEAIRNLGLQTSGMEFASEMVVRAGLEKLAIEETPTTLRKDGRGRPPHLRSWRDGWRHLKFLLMYSPRWLYLVPGLLLSSLGLLLALALAGGPIAIGNVFLDTNSFIAGCVMTVIGHQLLAYALIARYYAARTGMLPHHARADRLLAICKTDRMLIASAILLLIGISVFAGALALWARAGFGELTGSGVTRIAVAGLSVVMIGL